MEIPCRATHWGDGPAQRPLDVVTVTTRTDEDSRAARASGGASNWLARFGVETSGYGRSPSTA
jgi:hypothetical protein